MYRYLLFALIILVTLALGDVVKKTGVHGDTQPGYVTQIKELEQAMTKELAWGDMEAYSKHIADDYTRINVGGEIETRDDEAIREFTQSYRPVEMKVSDLEVAIYGETAILTGLLSVPSRGPDKSIIRTRYRKVFIHRNGEWYLVSVQQTGMNQ